MFQDLAQQIPCSDLTSSSNKSRQTEELMVSTPTNSYKIYQLQVIRITEKTQ